MKNSTRMILAAGTICALGGVSWGDTVEGAKQKGTLPGKRLVMLPPPSGPDGPGFSENFDSYANGSGLVPQGGWLYWNGSGPPGALNATIDNTLSVSGPNSAVGAVESDNVQVFNITSGHWICKVQTYTPSTATGIGYFIMLNTYANPYVSGGNWSIEIHFETATSLVTSINRTMATGGPGNTTVPLVTNQWVELVLDIDLAADTFNVTYGGAPLVPASPLNKWSQNVSAAVGAQRIQCIDLYSQMAGFRWDDLSLQPLATATCYANCDSSTNPPCLNVNDFICFNNLYAAGGAQANCDASTNPPILNVNDFICFNNGYAAGCGANNCAPHP